MKKTISLALLCAFFFQLSSSALYAQSSPAGEGAAQNTDAKQFPQWALDMRRAEIVAFGSLPFSWFLTILFTDLARSAAHGWNDLYWPWPAKPAGAVQMSSSEYGSTLFIAAGLSLIIAATDHLIVRNKRYYSDMRRGLSSQEGAVIERSPLFPSAAEPEKEPAAPPEEAAPPEDDGGTR